MPSTSRWRRRSTAWPSRPPVISCSKAAPSRTATPNTSSPRAAARRRPQADFGQLFPTSKAPARAGAFLLRYQSIACLKHREIFQQRDDADDDDDDARDLLGAAVQRQHVDQIEHQNDDEKGDQDTDEYRHGGAPFACASLTGSMHGIEQTDPAKVPRNGTQNPNYANSFAHSE